MTMNKIDRYTSFKQWLDELQKTETPVEDLKAFNFGLYESEQGYIVYLIGSKAFDPDDPDWACEPVDFQPKNNTFEIPESDGMDWLDVQTMMTAFVKKALENLPDPTFITPKHAVTVGFDDGDLIQVQ